MRAGELCCITDPTGSWPPILRELVGSAAGFGSDSRIQHLSKVDEDSATQSLRATLPQRDVKHVAAHTCFLDPARESAFGRGWQPSPRSSVAQWTRSRSNLGGGLSARQQ